MQITPTEGSYFATAELSYAWHADECAGCGKARRQFGYGLFLPSGPNATTMKCGILTIVLLKVDSNCELYHRPAPLNVARSIGKGKQYPARTRRRRARTFSAQSR